MKLEIAEVKSVHCCLERGVKLRAKTCSPITGGHLHEIQQAHPNIRDLVIVDVPGGGFYRFSLPGGATVSGVIGTTSFHVMYSLYARTIALNELNTLFPGFVDEFEVERAENVTGAVWED